jgi:hypothetical protein
MGIHVLRQLYIKLKSIYILGVSSIDTNFVFDQIIGFESIFQLIADHIPDIESQAID